jgi:hypothetical protein
MRNPFAALAQDQQVGARTKAMGGSYTAFEDDPISVWLNPAGIATQPDGLAVSYQTYPTYEASWDQNLIINTDFTGVARQGWNDPVFIPSYLGVVVQVGSPENPHSFGFCFASPYQLRFPFSQLADTDVPGADFSQSFYRFRFSYAQDFRFSPPGTEGFFTHLAVGLAFDVGISNLHFREYVGEIFPGTPVEINATATGYGGGAGLLLGVFDDTRTFKVNLGFAYQSKISYNFSADTTFTPLFDSPHQLQVGVTFYLLDGLPLRVTLDAQFILWDGATQNSALDLNNFRNASNFSGGLEYRLKLPFISDAVTFYPRAGIRRFDAPWENPDSNQLPAIGSRRLTIDTRAGTFWIGSAGLGVGWSTQDGKGRMFDLAVDFGGDVVGLAFSFSLEL